MIILFKKGKSYFKKKTLTKKVPNPPDQDASSEICSTYDTPPSSPETYSKPHTPSSSTEACSTRSTSPISPNVYSKPHTPSSSETHSVPISPSSSSEARTPAASPESPHAREENQNDNLPRQIYPNRSIYGLEPFEIEEVSRRLVKKYKEWSKIAKKRRYSRSPEHEKLYEDKLGECIIQLRDKELDRDNVPVNRETVVANLDTFVIFLEKLNDLKERTAANISELFYELFNDENSFLFGEVMFASNRTKMKHAIEEHIILKRYKESNPSKLNI